MRIVSLLPSATEIVFAIGAGDELVGVTFECDFPSDARARRIVSTSTLTPGMTPGQIDREVRARLAAGDDLYRLDEGALRDVDPDLVITQDLCAVCAVDVATVDAALTHLGCAGQVLTIDPGRLTDVLDSILTIGAATGRAVTANHLVASLRARLDTVATAVAGRPLPRIAVLEWTDPPFTAGHWIPDMIESAGAVPVFGVAGQRSVSTTWETLARPGPRLVDGVETLAAIAHPGWLPTRPELSVLVTG